jgi:hypothetical protein
VTLSHHDQYLQAMEHLGCVLNDRALRVYETFLSGRRGDVDVVFDDWSHNYVDVLYAFVELFPLLSSGGVYVVTVRGVCACALRTSHSADRH